MNRRDLLGFGPLAAAAAVALPRLVAAGSYLTTEAAQRALFPEAQEFTTLAIAPTPAQLAVIAQKSGPQPMHRDLHAWVAKRGSEVMGHVFVDEVIGRNDFITYSVGIDQRGVLLPVEILEYRESHGGEIRNARWRAQFAGRDSTEALQFRADIKNIAGATLSSEHVTAGVRRILALWQTLIGPARK
jgi:electron transport complex protein RnfG